MRTEEEILYDFEKRGYEILGNDNYFCRMENVYDKRTILIHKVLNNTYCYECVSKPYQTIIDGTKMKTKTFPARQPCALQISEFELLHELFEIWGWIKEAKKVCLSGSVYDGEVLYDKCLCPNCEREFHLDYEDQHAYCPDCGQKLDWSDIDD